MRPTRILIVEDDTAQAGTIELLLAKRLAADIDIADSCAVARQKLASQRYNLVTLDLQLPDGDGLSLLEEMTGMKDAPPTVVVTGHGNENAAVQAFKLGAAGYVMKDNRFSTMLIEEARSALDRAALQEAQEAIKTNEERFRSLLENALDGIIVMNENLETTYSSPSVEKIIGFTMDELAEKGVELLHPDDLEASVALAYEAFANPGTLYITEFRLADRDGSWRDIEVRGTARVNDSGELELVINGREITDRKKAEEQLRESEEMFRQLAEHTSAGIIIYQGTEFKYVNKAALEMTGYTLEESRHLNFWDLVAPGFKETVKERGLARQRGQKVPSRYEIPAITKSGAAIWIDFSAVEIEYEGKSAGIATFVDITDSKRAEEALRRANAELRGYADTVSHDIKGPLGTTLTGLNTLVQLMKDPDTEPDRATLLELAGALSANIKKSHAMVDDLLALAASGQTPEETEEIDVGGVVARVLNELEPEILERNVAVEVDDGLGTIVANGTQIYQIFANLLGNAVRHNDAENPRVKVQNLGDDAPGLHHYRVCENSSGIPEDIMARLFEPFFRGKGSGTGIGLAIVDKLVKVYGGAISAYNEGGACFEFTIGDLEASPPV